MVPTVSWENARPSREGLRRAGGGLQPEAAGAPSNRPGPGLPVSGMSQGHGAHANATGFGACPAAVCLCLRPQNSCRTPPANPEGAPTPGMEDLSECPVDPSHCHARHQASPHPLSPESEGCPRAHA